MKDSGSALTRGDVLYESQVRCSALGKNIAHGRLLMKNSPISLNLPLPSTTSIIRAITATATAKMALYSCLLSGIKEYAKTHVRTEPPNHAERGAPVYSGNVDSTHDYFKTVALKSMANDGVVIPEGQEDDFVELWVDVTTFRSFCKSYSMHDSAISETDIRRVCRKVRRNLSSRRGPGRGAPYGTSSSSLPTTSCQEGVEIRWIFSFALAPGVGQINANAGRICPWVQ